jgi:hypothetical protein
LLLEQEGRFKMRKIIYVLLIVLLFSPMTWGQDIVEAPVWNVGDKWIFDKGSIEVVDKNENSYTLNFSKDFNQSENMGFEKIVLDRSTLNRIYIIYEAKTEKYHGGLKRILNFPLNLKKEWQDNYSGYFDNNKAYGPSDYTEYYQVLGWQDVNVQAGKFKAIKIERIVKPSQAGFSTFANVRAIYWYVPGVKYFVKCRFNLSLAHFFSSYEWELVSFKLKK